MLFMEVFSIQGTISIKINVLHKRINSTKKCANNNQARSHAQAHQRRQHHQQRNDLAADVFLLKAEDAVDE